MLGITEKTRDELVAIIGNSTGTLNGFQVTAIINTLGGLQPVQEAPPVPPVKKETEEVDP